MSYVINPRTGRRIKVGGPTHKALKSLPKTRKSKRKSIIKRSGSRTRGWASMSPQRGSERHSLMKKCGKKCFLSPANEGFPVCSASRMGQGCKYNCKGIMSAKIRARQYHHNAIARSAERLLKKYC